MVLALLRVVFEPLHVPLLKRQQSRRVIFNMSKDAFEKVLAPSDSEIPKESSDALAER